VETGRQLGQLEVDRGQPGPELGLLERRQLVVDPELDPTRTVDAGADGGEDRDRFAEPGG
jgi:hypothetical protein